MGDAKEDAINLQLPCHKILRRRSIMATRKRCPGRFARLGTVPWQHVGFTLNELQVLRILRAVSWL